ncbi:MAG: 6-phosphogluconolactonase [Candidatus Nanoarchaeia archaeon]
MRIVRASTEDIPKIAVDILRGAVHNVLEKKDECVLAIPGGRSATSTFNLLKEETLFPWKRVHIFMVDERLVSLTGTESNFRRAKEAFLDHLVKTRLLPEKNIHPFVHDGEAKKYAEKLKKYGGKFDIVLLGAGEDGHVAGLFPHHAALEAKTKRFVTLHDAPKPPKDRMTASRALIEDADTAIVLFMGDSKKRAFKMFQEGRNDVEDCPAKMVLSAKNPYALTDIRE